MACQVCGNVPHLWEASWLYGAKSIQVPKWSYVFLPITPTRQDAALRGGHRSSRTKHEVGESVKTGLSRIRVLR